MFTAHQTFKVRTTAIKILKRYLQCRKTDAKFTLCHPCHRKNYSLAAWVTLSPVSQRWEIHFRSNRLTVCDFRECTVFDSFINEKARLKIEKKAKKERTDAEDELLATLQCNMKLWVDIMGTKKHMGAKRVELMQQMVERQEPLSRDAKHVGGNVEGLLARIFQ